jgi:cytochrome c-type biogenesis protein CcmH
MRLRSALIEPIRALLLALAVAMCLPGPAAVAVEPDEILADPALEKRARELSTEFRCLVCQNQSIDDSSAPLAKDLRLLVRERLKAGDSDDAVRKFVVARYGEFVLLKPPLSWHTVALWFAPAVLLVLGFWLALRTMRRRPVAAAEGGEAKTLSAEEQARLQDLLEDEN